MTYNEKRKVSIRIYPDVDSDDRKTLFAHLNGARGGDHASSSRSAWLAPRPGPEWIAKQLVALSPHLGDANVNTVHDRVTSKDPRLCGHNTIVESVKSGFGDEGDISTEQSKKIARFLVRFWNHLAEALPAMGKMPLGDRNALRRSSILGHSLAVYGFMAVAKKLYDDEISLDCLDELATAQEWFLLTNPMWKDIGVMTPIVDKKTLTVTGYRTSSNYQTRRALSTAVLRFMFPGGELAVA